MTLGAIPPGLRERKKAQTREAIVAAAIDLFERKGYDATTIEEIAEAADVSPRTFFRYFDAKIDVVMDNKDGRSDDLGSRLSDRPRDEGPVVAMCKVMTDDLGTMVRDNPLFVRQMRLMMGTPTLLAHARDHFHDHEDDMVRDIAERLDLPEDDLRVHVIASAVGNTIWTVVSRWVAENGSPDRLLEMITEACTLLCSGLDLKPPD
jgi:AcrR family transcriptional regulator